jgi:hypothetical protein
MALLHYRIPDLSLVHQSLGGLILHLCHDEARLNVSLDHSQYSSRPTPLPAKYLLQQARRDDKKYSDEPALDPINLN